MKFNIKCVVNPSRSMLIEDAIRRNEGTIAHDGQFVVRTGKHTGRAAKSKYVVNNLPDLSLGGSAGTEMSQGEFDNITLCISAFCYALELYVVNFTAGGKRCRLVCEKAWHALFVMNLFPVIDLDDATSPDLTIIDIPRFNMMKHETFIACDYKQGLVLIGGTEYAGEIKKSVFSYLACVLPDEGVLPMHSSISTLLDSSVPTIFFGLSGTGKTTLSAGTGMRLLGDDEHGWSNSGVFNFEGGCYAKAIDLDVKREPQIWKASSTMFTVLENVVLDQRGNPIFTDRTITENTRSAYPLNLIDDSYPVGTTLGHPKNIILLTCDANGVLPGVSKPTIEQALYQFVNGYTAKVAGTEIGLTAPQTTFSACYGAPFMTRNLKTYLKMLHDRLIKHSSDVWLVNTGWIGGPPGVGHRSSLQETRNIISDIQTGRLKARIDSGSITVRTDEVTGMGVPEGTFNCYPKRAWNDANAYDAAAKKLTNEFVKNFEDLKPKLDNYALLDGTCFTSLRG